MRLQNSLLLGMLFFLAFIAGNRPYSVAFAQSAETGESPEQQRERITAERFLVLLQKAPRLGTALDRVYGYHVGNGSLDEFCQTLKEQAETGQEGSTWMILGMVQMLRGQDAEAVLALEKAEQALPDNSLPSYYLGKTLVLVGEFDKATSALERAIEKKPARTDMLEIFQSLGRLYQRTGNNEQALEVWKRLEDLYPGDDQVREEIAQILIDEGAMKPALERFEALAKTHKDQTRRVEMAVRAAEIRAKMGQTEQALKDFETQLARINPGSWLHRDIRCRIEEVFYSSNDIDGLINYYTAWNEAHPEDVDAMMRAGRILSIQHRRPEAEQWFRKAIEKSPSDVGSRLALVDALVRENDYVAAAEQMEKLVELQPGNPDYIIRWGEMVYNDENVSKPERQQAAQKIFAQLLIDHENDAVMVSRYADLLRGMDLVEPAIEHYQRAIELAPQEPQYREYLGEYLHKQDRTEEALVTWKSLAEGERLTRDNLVRLSEVYSTFHYEELALQAMTEACQMNPIFAHRARLAELLLEAKRYEESLQEIERARLIAEDSPSHEIVLDLLIRNYQNSGQLEQRIEDQVALVESTHKEKAEAWRMLALLYQADRKFHNACDSIEKATQLQPDDSLNWTSSAKLHEQTGRYGEAINDYRQLTRIDRRYLGEYLTQIASLEMRIGNADAALKTAEDLISSSPGNAQNYQFFASLCFQAGMSEKGLDVLRRSVRANPNDREAILYLAKTLSEEFQTEEAIEFYWRAFDLGKEVDDQLQVIPALVELYLRTNRFDTLMTRLETIGRESNKSRDQTLWMAEASRASGDLGMARELLEQLVRSDSRDTKLLEQLVKLAQAEYDTPAAIEYQQRLVSIAPSPQAEYQLAMMLISAGEIDQAEMLWKKLTARGRKTDDIVRTCTSLSQSGDREAAIRLVERSMDLDPENWELKVLALNLYMREEKKSEALEIVRQIKAMKVKPTTLTEKTREALEKAKQSQNRNLSQDYTLYQGQIAGRRLQFLNMAYSAKNALLGLDPYQNYPASMSLPFTGFISFRDALMIADIAECYASHQEDLSEFIEQKTTQALESKNPEDLWQALIYLGTQQSSILYNKSPQTDRALQCLDALLVLDDADAAYIKLSYLISQRTHKTQDPNRTQVAIPPLEPDELEEWLSLYEKSELQLTAGNYYGDNLLLQLSTELRRLGRIEEADRYLDAYLESRANNASNLLQASRSLLSLQLNDEEQQKQLLIRSMQVFQEALAVCTNSSNSSANWYYIPYALSEFEGKIPDEEFARLLDHLFLMQAKMSEQLRPSQRNKIDPSAQSLPYLYVKNRYTQVQLTFPPICGYFSKETIAGLKCVHELWKDAPTQLALLKNFLIERAGQETDDQYLKITRLLALASFYYWIDEKPSALAVLEKTKAAGMDETVADLTIARLLYEVGRPGDALQLVRNLRPTNQQMLVDRELAILQLVLEQGELDQARQSAQRLFALRLKADVEFKIADLMYQLNMKDLGDKMMGRIRRRSGGSKDTLVQLMNRYINAKENDAAAEVAMQVVRRTSPSASARSRTSDNMLHEAALRILQTTGKLEPLITRTEEQLERSPNSTLLIQSLASYYMAAGRRQAADKLLSRIDNKKVSKDPQVLYHLGQQLAQSGKHEEAVTQFLLVLEKNPDQLGDSYYQMKPSFNAAKKIDKLIDLIIRLGPDRFRNSSYIFDEMVSQLLQDKQENLADKFLTATIKSTDWTASSSLSRILTRSTFKPSEELLTAIKAKLLDGNSLQGGTSGLQVHSYGSGGRIHIPVGILIHFVKQHDPETLRLIANASQDVLAENPSLLLPRYLLALTQICVGKMEEALKTIQPVRDVEHKMPEHWNFLWGISGEFLGQPAGLHACIEIMQEVSQAAETDTNLGIRGLSFQSSPRALLLDAYQQAKQSDKAHDLIIDTLQNLKVEDQFSGRNQGYEAYQYLNNYHSLIDQLIKSGFPLEASLYLSKVSNDKQKIEAAARWGQNFQSKIDSYRKSIRKQVTPEELLGFFKFLLHSEGSVDSALSENKNPIPDTSLLFTPAIVKPTLLSAQVNISLLDLVSALNTLNAQQSILKEQQNDLTLESISSPTLNQILTWAILQSHWKIQDNSKLTGYLERWLESNVPPNVSLPLDEAETSAVQQELLLCLAADQFQQEDDVDLELIAQLYERSKRAAELLGENELAITLNCRLAEKFSGHDDARSREILLSTLQQLFP